jgi:hypothetical protein
MKRYGIVLNSSTTDHWLIPVQGFRLGEQLEALLQADAPVVRRRNGELQVPERVERRRRIAADLALYGRFQLANEYVRDGTVLSEPVPSPEFVCPCANAGRKKPKNQTSCLEVPQKAD